MSVNDFNHQGKGNYSASEQRRNTEDLQMTPRLMDSSNQNASNILLPGHQTSVTSSILNYQNTSFGSLYSSPGFNCSLASYENNLQWLSESRIQNQHTQLIPDKSIPTSSHSLPQTSHSCCVNKFGMLDSLGMASPIPHDQVKSACDVSNFQNKSALTMNMMDPIQSWLNLPIPSQIPSNQQYCKYSERSVPGSQNYNNPISAASQISVASQICLPVLGLDQSDLKQNDMCMQSPDACFENINNANNKPIESSTKQQSFTTDIKQVTMQEQNTMISKQSAYQSSTSMMAKDWKAPFQNYISSPNVFNAMNEPQDNYVFAQYSMQPANSYYTAPDNSYPSFVNKNNTFIPQTKTSYTRGENTPSQQNSFMSQSQIKINTTTQNVAQIHNTSSSFYPPKQLLKEGEKLQIAHKHHSNRSVGMYSDALNNCCQINKSQGSELISGLNNCFPSAVNNQDNTNPGNKSSLLLETKSQTDKRRLKSSETVSSESDESNIIVEESDEIGEIESEISIEEIKKTYEANGNQVLLRCLICNLATSSQTPANQFIHMNDSFPLTSSSKIPIRSKLEQILPVDFQLYLKKHDSFMCRRCLNLVETVEILEVKLSTAKQTLTENFSKTVQQLIPNLEHIIHNEVIAQDVSQLLQNDNVSKSLPEENNAKMAKSFEELEQHSVENECPNEEKALSTSDIEPAEFQCSYCFKLLSSQKNLNYHLQQHTKEFCYYCERCGKGFPLKYNLQRHLNWHNSEEREANILCDVCGEIFVTNNIFKSHLLKIHSQEYIYMCKTCGKGFTRKISLEIHSHKHTGARMFICEYCGHTFISESNLRNHIKRCNKDFQYTCEECGKWFASQSQLSRHESQHTGVFKLSCPVCSKGFHKPSDLNFHMLSHSTDKQFKCKDCDKSFKAQGNLNYHVKTVHKEESIFKCDICAKNFFQERLLSDHVKSHANEKPYKCNQCDKSFVHQTTFISHLKVHQGKVKLKTCEVCGKSIKTRMSVHMRSHTGQRPYKCSYCPLAFTVGISLKKHVSAKHFKSDVLLG